MKTSWACQVLVVVFSKGSNQVWVTLAELVAVATTFSQGSILVVRETLVEKLTLILMLVVVPFCLYALLYLTRRFNGGSTSSSTTSSSTSSGVTPPGSSSTLGCLTARDVTLGVCVLFWCLRLGAFLTARIAATPGRRDSRFDRARSAPPLFLLYWTLQGLWVTLTLLPVLLVFTSNSSSNNSSSIRSSNTNNMSGNSSNSSITRTSTMMTMTSGGGGVEASSSGMLSTTDVLGKKK